MTLFDILKLGGGLAFFLYGMNMMSQSLTKLAGSRMEEILRRMTGSPLRGLILGILVTGVVQSSSAVTVMLVGLVNSGLMKLSQSVGVIMGANIGTTVTAWILSLAGVNSSAPWVQMLKPANLALLCAMGGILLFMLSKSEKKQDVGVIFLGFALLMYGMEMMSGAVSPLRDVPQFRELMVSFRSPLMGLLAGTLLTAVIQSSSASVGILQALALTGCIPYSAAVPIIMGQNIGTCITALIASVGTRKAAKQVAILHILFNAIGSTVFLTLFCLYNTLFAPAILQEAATPAGIALCHSIFNLLTTALLFPFQKVLVRLAGRIGGDKPVPETREGELLDEHILAVPSLTVGACRGLVRTMAQGAQYAIQTGLRLLTGGYDPAARSALEANEETLDDYEDKLGGYLARISGQGLSPADSLARFRMQHAIGDLERLGDHALNLADTAKEAHDKHITFSPGARQDLLTLSRAVEDILDLTIRACDENDPALAAGVEPREQVIDALIRRARDKHFRRLDRGECTLEMGFLLADALGNLERISDHCSNLAVAVIEESQDRFDAHEYLESRKAADPRFQGEYDRFAEKYAL